MTDQIVPVVMCGGIGTRLWPLSRSAEPKQFQPLASDRSMLVETLARFQGPGFGDPMLLGNAAHLDLVHASLRAAGCASFRVLIEPVIRSTGPAIAAAAVTLAATAPQALMLVSPSDHVVGDPAALQAAVAAAAPRAAAGAIVLFGITPEKPETGFGYIRAKAGAGPIYDVAGFIEKPKYERAVELVAAGDCYWNSGMFLFSVATILDELQRYAPELLAAARASVAQARVDGTTLWLDQAGFAAAPTLSIDYAVMEKSNRCAVIPVSPQWSDVGSWEALWEIGRKDANGNVVSGDAIAQQSSNCLVQAGDRLVTLLGVDDLVIVDTRDAVLVMAREKSQDVKAIVTALDTARRPEARQHRVRRMSWGTAERLLQSGGGEVEHLALAAGTTAELAAGGRQRLVVVGGSGTCTGGGTTQPLAAGASIELTAAARLQAAGAGLDVVLVRWPAT